MKLPVYDKINKYAEERRISFAMPGHKGGAGRPELGDILRLDVTELAGTPDLLHRDESVREAELALSRVYKTKSSRILIGGSTEGIFAMLLWALKPGDTLLANRTAHMSVINACALFGFNVVLMPQSINAEFMIPNPVTAETVQQGLKLYPNAKAVLVTSPSYYGQCADIKEIAKVTAQSGIPLLVDEAHGAAFAAGDFMPETAIECGAAMSVMSAHKTLNAMNGAAYLHIMHEDSVRIDEILQMVSTSSPSYLIAATADMARADIENGGWEHTWKMCVSAAEKIERGTDIKVLKNDDRTRLVLNFSKYALTGRRASELLCEKGIDAEMADEYNVVLIVTPSNTDEDIKNLIKEVKNICANAEKRTEPVKPAAKITAFSLCEPHKAFFAEGECVDTEKCIGRISKETITVYPPGIPVVSAGETITEETAVMITEMTGRREIKVIARE